MGGKAGANLKDKSIVIAVNSVEKTPPHRQPIRTPRDIVSQLMPPRYYLRVLIVNMHGLLAG
jgi:hypothetical protein